MVQDTSAQPIHAYFKSRVASEAQLQQEVDFAISCGMEYAHNVATHLGRSAAALPDLSSTSILELGPGLNLGAMLVCAALGARVAAFDKYLVAWNTDYHPRFYALLRERAAASFAGDFAAIDGVLRAQSHATDLVRAVAGDLSRRVALAGGAFDAVVSNAMLEHVRDVRRACRELFRITKPGGAGIHQVDFRDHGRPEDAPLGFLTVPDRDFARTFAASLGGSGNRVRAGELCAEFERAGFAVVRFDPNCWADAAHVQAVRPRLLDRYARMSDEELRVVGGRVFVRRPLTARRRLFGWLG